MLYEDVDGHAKFAYNGRTHLLHGMECPNKNLLADDLTWRAILEPSLCNDSAGIEALARLLFTLKRAIDSGPEGAMRASRTLLNGIELVYLHTNAHKAALKLYVLSLEGDLKPQDEPLRLINAAIERGISHRR
jgi:hypothetical protein